MKRASKSYLLMVVALLLCTAGFDDCSAEGRAERNCKLVRSLAGADEGDRCDEDLKNKAAERVSGFGMSDALIGAGVGAGLGGKPLCPTCSGEGVRWGYKDGKVDGNNKPVRPKNFKICEGCGGKGTEPAAPAELLED